MPKITVECVECGKPFEVERYLRAKGKGLYCGRTCQHASMRLDAVTRFWSKVDKSGDCWTWMAGRQNKPGFDYGQFWPTTARPVAAHRFAWEIENGPVPDGMLVCHQCDNPPCVRPGHLFLGTSKQNTADMIAKGRKRHGAPNRRRGESHPNARTDEATVREIRRQVAEGVAVREIARRFGLHRDTVHRIAKRLLWAHVE